MLFFKASAQARHRLVNQGCSTYVCHGLLFILFNCCVDIVMFRKAYMKPKDKHDKEHCILGGEVLSEPAWGLFRPVCSTGQSHAVTELLP